MDRRSQDWSEGILKFQSEEERLHERVRELAEQNISLQREVTFVEANKADASAKVASLELQNKKLNDELEKLRCKHDDLHNSSADLHARLTEVTEERGHLGGYLKDKEDENRALHKVIARLQMTCNEQERTITSLRQGYRSELDKSVECSSDKMNKLQMELIGLTGVERKLRGEVRSCHLEVESLRHENIALLNRLQSAGNGSSIPRIRLNQELQAIVDKLQTQSLPWQRTGTFAIIYIKRDDPWEIGCANPAAQDTIGPLPTSTRKTHRGIIRSGSKSINSAMGSVPRMARARALARRVAVFLNCATTPQPREQSCEAAGLILKIGIITGTKGKASTRKRSISKGHGRRNDAKTGVDEDAQHILTTCVFARQFWFKILAPLDFIRCVPSRHEESFAEWWGKARKKVQKENRKGLNSLIILGGWILWRHRNACVFNGALPCINTILREFENEKHLWGLTGARSLRALTQVEEVRHHVLGRTEGLTGIVLPPSNNIRTWGSSKVKQAEEEKTLLPFFNTPNFASAERVVRRGAGRAPPPPRRRTVRLHHARGGVHMAPSIRPRSSSAASWSEPRRRRSSSATPWNESRRRRSSSAPWSELHRPRLASSAS
ncbi:hypothetical protein EJB05_13203, partial [Eragrostis curvula]